MDLPTKKRKLRDAHCAYGIDGPLNICPRIVSGDKQVNIDHTFWCPTGKYPTIRHNKIQDLLASLMTAVCADVTAEPVLQPLTGGSFCHRTTSTDNKARLDIRTTRTTTPSYSINSLTSFCYRHREQPKRDASFAPLVFSVTGGWDASFAPLVFSITEGASPLTATYLKHLCSLLAVKQNLACSITIGWL